MPTTTTTCPVLLQPLAQSPTSEIQMLPSLNMTNQDFNSLKTRLALFVEQRFPNDFTDFFESDLGVMLMEMWAFCADMLSFKMDQVANEIYIDSVGELDNAFRLAQAFGYQPTPPIAASALFSATINSLLAIDLVIPAGFQVSTGGSLIYELFPADPLNNPIFNQNILIPAGSFTNTAIVGIQGQTFIDTFTSTGVINQNFTLNQGPVIFGSVQVMVNGTTWTQVDFFTSSQPSFEYRVVYDSNYNAFVIFGNTQAGYIPTQGSQIQITYRVGGGAAGGVVTGAFSVQSGFVVPGFNITVPVTITNYTAGVGGYDGDQIADIQNSLPAYNQIQNRCVTGQDYKLAAELYVSPYNGQVGKATAVLRNTGCAGNVVDLFVLAQDGANGLVTASDQLKVELADYLSGLQMITDQVCVKDGVILFVDTLIDLSISKFYSNFSSQIQAQAQQLVNNFFMLSNWEYGQVLTANNLLQQLAGISQVTNTTISFTTNDPNQASNSVVVPTYYQIIQSDSVSITLTFE
jgi:hypothetical protein